MSLRDMLIGVWLCAERERIGFQDGLSLCTYLFSERAAIRAYQGERERELLQFAYFLPSRRRKM
jgi:hypothetical protein